MTPFAVIDAFAAAPFGGNPAAVCLLSATAEWPSDEWLQRVAREFNLSETAFLRHREGCEHELRWFTPAVEVALCGHATLAAAHFLWERGATQDLLTFLTKKSGVLAARRQPTGEIELTFPAKPATACPAPPGLLDALGCAARAVARSEYDFLVEVASADDVGTLVPDFAKLARVKCRGVIVTAKSADPQYDFVSRFFAPAEGINEDPVTGSAHCCLSEWWGPKLKKDVMTGYQVSARGGAVGVRRDGAWVKLSGRAATVSRGEFLIPPG
ncbi:MAG: PhzF family phenazine biosynthesis protein [Planctomycetes bacterium]|nr:PhzF family phenazine biosynthesis protein [Planctomycetota bacterium]